MMKLQRVVSFGLAGLFCLLVSDRSEAGAGYQYAYCSNNADGSGMCYGTLRDFRASTNANDYAGFSQWSDGYKSFNASFGGLFATCSPDATTATLWPAAMAFTGNFSIEWNASAVCYSLSLSNGSWT